MIFDYVRVWVPGALYLTSFPWQIMCQLEGEGRFGGHWMPQSGNGGHGSGR